MKLQRQKWLVWLLAIAILIIPISASTGKLEFKTEDEVEQVLAEESFVLLLLGENEECIDVCEELEDTLAAVREDVVESLNAWVLRTYSPKLNTEYGIKGSQVIFLRNGVPLLYTGPPDDDEFLLHYLVTNQNSFVKLLTDDNFEHDTQASTGATTGDWFVMFTKAECEACQQLVATFEAVAANLNGRKNIALVERDIGGGATTRRFDIKEFPAFVLFRLGRLYRYDFPVVEAQALIAFATDGFRNARGEEIPQPKSPFDDLTEKIADFLRENPNYLYGGMGAVVLIFITLIYCATRRKPEPKKKDTKKKK